MASWKVALSATRWHRRPVQRLETPTPWKRVNFDGYVAQSWKRGPGWTFHDCWKWCVAWCVAGTNHSHASGAKPITNVPGEQSKLSLLFPCAYARSTAIYVGNCACDANGVLTMIVTTIVRPLAMRNLKIHRTGSS